MAPFTTQVTDTLYAPDGTLVTGNINISTTQTFVSADGFTILQGFTISVPVADGLFSINLVPNEGTTPASTYYVSVEATALWFVQTWFVPYSTSPVNLAQVVVP